MGMAASQARLLSITSRMSDNELRSQLINNAKMRLTEDSSKASEKYLAALNATQLMFSNYNLEGESQYQRLTFNNLTAYSAYNNQYGVVNKGGELLVSELDSSRYEAALLAAKQDKEVDQNNPDAVNARALEEFLKSYGLIKDTTYFEKPDLYKLDEHIREIYEGDMVYEYHGGDHPHAERVSGIHMGYEESKKSKDYAIYKSLLADYTSTKKVYEAAIKTEMQNYVLKLDHCNCPNGVAGLPHPAVADKPYKETYEDFILWVNTVYDADGNFNDTSVGSAKHYQQQMGIFYHQILTEGNFSANSAAFKERMEYYLSLNVSGGVQEAPVDAYEREGYTPTLTKGPDNDNDGKPDYYYYVFEESLDKQHPVKKDTNGQQIPLKHKIEVGKDDAGNPIYEEYPVKEIYQRQLSKEEYVQSMIDMYRFFQSEVLGTLEKGNFVTASAADAQNKYYEAARKLSFFIYGQDIGANFDTDYYDKLDDTEWIIFGDLNNPNDPNSGRKNNPIAPTTALDTSEGGVLADLTAPDFIIPGVLEEETDANGNVINPFPRPANFQVVKDIFLSEKMMELYGTPKYEWIDINNPEEDGEKKAQWYTNLFERMNEGGYATLENGLASSAEWLQFALESGLISMEQVDVKNQWISTMYSNCSNITESQVEIDITIAEAEYNKTMNEIERKDKRYDLELKNIDTEHQSLQTEYDSIKSVIDKNVERNFKMFEA